MNYVNLLATFNLKAVHRTYIVFLFLMLIFVICINPEDAYSKTVRGRVNLYKSVSIIVQVNVEIADTPWKRHQGLMGRKNLGQEEGMLFVFDKEDFRSFWMKNTLIHLDIIFISRDFKVVSFVKNAKPCKSLPCGTYHSEYPAMYVLEVNSGFIDQYGIDDRTRIDILPWKGE